MSGMKAIEVALLVLVTILYFEGDDDAKASGNQLIVSIDFSYRLYGANGKINDHAVFEIFQRDILHHFDSQIVSGVQYNSRAVYHPHLRPGMASLSCALIRKGYKDIFIYVLQCDVESPIYSVHLTHIGASPEDSPYEGVPNVFKDMRISLERYF